MAASVDIVLRKDKVNKNNLSPLHIRIIKNRKVRYLATGIKMENKYWDDLKRKVKKGFPNSTRVNNYLNTLKVKYHDEVLKAETRDTTISSKNIKKKIIGNNDVDFFEVANQLIEKYKLSTRTRTTNKSISIKNKIKDFINSEKLHLEDITPLFLNKYETYLSTKLNNKINTIGKDLRFIRRVFNEACRLELITQDKNPFHNFIVKTEKTKKEFLTEPEIRRIEKLNFSKDFKLNLYRDMFIFSCYTGGTRVSDTLLLQWKQFDKTHIYLTIEKTITPLSIKLPEKSIKIIKHYQKLKANKTFIFPMLNENIDTSDIPKVERAISNATTIINKSLKKIAKEANIEKNLSFHVARHTWATRALRKGISIDKVSKLMGHSAIKETQIYAKIVNKELDKAMDVFND